MVDLINPLENCIGLGVEWGPYSSSLYSRQNISKTVKDFPSVNYSTSPHHLIGGQTPTTLTCHSTEGLLPRVFYWNLDVDV